MRQWANGVVRVLASNLKRRKVGVTGELLKSLHDEVVVRGNEIIASISADYTIRFSDMGAGRGQTARQARSARRTARKRKPVYNRTVYGALNSLQGAVGRVVMQSVLDQYEQSAVTQINL